MVDFVAWESGRVRVPFGGLIYAARFENGTRCVSYLALR